MATIEVAEVKVDTIVKILIKDPKLIKNWSSFYESLELKVEDKASLERRVNQGEHPEPIFTETLTLWLGGAEVKLVKDLAVILEYDDYINTASKLRKEHGNAKLVIRLTKKPPKEGPKTKATNDIIPINRKPKIHDFKDNIVALNVIVKKSEYRIGQGDPKVYQLNSNQKGCALIISNFEFEDSGHNRPGGKQDGDYMNHLLSQLGFKCIHKPNLSSKDLDKAIEAFKAVLIATNADSLIVVAMSHGKQDCILMSDGIFAHRLYNIAYQFDASNFPEFQNADQPDKPKLFFMQGCEGVTAFEEAEVMPFQDPESSSVPLMNALIVTSTLPGYPSQRDPYLGTHFIYCLTYVLMEHAHNTELEDMLEQVGREMQNIDCDDKKVQIILTNKMSFNKKFYFNPGL